MIYYLDTIPSTLIFSQGRKSTLSVKQGYLLELTISPAGQDPRRGSLEGSLEYVEVDFDDTTDRGDLSGQRD